MQNHFQNYEYLVHFLKISKNLEQGKFSVVHLANFFPHIVLKTSSPMYNNENKRLDENVVEIDVRYIFRSENDRKYFAFQISRRLLKILLSYGVKKTSNALFSLKAPTSSTYL